RASALAVHTIAWCAVGAGGGGRNGRGVRVFSGKKPLPPPPPPPPPPIPTVALPGFSFIQETSSRRSFGGKAAFATNHTGQSATSDIGSKSFTTSNGSAEVAPLTTCVCQGPRRTV